VGVMLTNEDVDRIRADWVDHVVAWLLGAWEDEHERDSTESE
jgi:hypothetical protein